MRTCERYTTAMPYNNPIFTSIKLCGPTTNANGNDSSETCYRQNDYKAKGLQCYDCLRQLRNTLEQVYESQQSSKHESVIHEEVSSPYVASFAGTERLSSVMWCQAIACMCRREVVARPPLTDGKDPGTV